jgi:Notch-like protein
MGRSSRGSRAGIFLGSALVALATAGDARAVIEQTDGSVVPISTGVCPGATDSCVQTPLNVGEGFAAAATNNPLKAVFDAAVAPEVFSIPRLNNVYGKITVNDLQEGAGYENTFGWYNVNAPASLYPITPCTDEPGSSRTVDFQVEFTQGRYLGGFIGFFLITPENQPVGTNCGAIGDVGHIYYTEQARNGDGNYVHYLLYHSKVNPLAYYFGFEDLFRGGDNDFDDMFLKVTGLLAPCTPSPEVCDGQDNNCDGLIDNSPVDAGGGCGSTSVGACKPGVLTCQNGALTCVGAVGPKPEQCNGVDDDCDGAVDDSPAGVGQSCGSNVGECLSGAQQCIGGVLVCVGGKGPSLEVCNLADDDCNGTVDDGTIDTGGPCGSNVGVCTPGALTCVSGVIQCAGGTQGGTEICNNLDDDCNGAVDDGDPGGGTACGLAVGTCKPGVEHCLGGKLTCVGQIGPTTELCDGLDNDCDGTGDNLAQCPAGSQCVAGACAAPCQGGEFPCPGGQTCVAGFCLPQTCDNVTCEPGTTCMQGICVLDPSGATGSAGTGSAGTGSGGAESTTASSSSGSSASSSGSASTGQGGAGSGNAWGLATGGGGLRCSARGGPSGGDAWALGAIGLLGLALLRRRDGGAS